MLFTTRSSVIVRNNMPLKILSSIVLLGLLLGVCAEIQIEPLTDTEYYIMDYKNNTLTITKKFANSPVITWPFQGSTEQKWVFKISGDKKDFGDLFVIRPSSEPDKFTLDSDHSRESWYAKLFDWSNSRLWIARETWYGRYQIIHNNEKLCLQSNGPGIVGLGSCDAGEPTWWTILPVEQKSLLDKLLLRPTPKYHDTTWPSTVPFTSTTGTSTTDISKAPSVVNDD